MAGRLTRIEERRAPARVLAAVVVVASVAPMFGHTIQPADVATLLAKLDAYLTDYETKVSALVANEVQTQRIEGLNHALLQVRRFSSEMAFLRLPSDREGLGHRRIHTVDGRRVGPVSATSLVRLFGQGAREAVLAAAEIVEESARFNLGLQRSVNVPTLPLELAHPRRRAYRVSAKGDVTLGGRQRHLLELVEPESGSIVHYGVGRYFSTSVRLWVDADGAVHRGEVEMRPHCNYRRFTTSTRILPGPP